MEVRRLDVGELGGLGPLLAVHRYDNYRLYRRFSPEDRVRVLAHELATAAARGEIIAVVDGGRFVGVGALEPLAWDSRLFGVPMGRMGTLVVDPNAPVRDVLSRLLDALLMSARRGGLCHLSARTDTGDLEAAQALEARGFRLMDCLITYAFDCRRDVVAEVKRLNPIRHYQPSDRDAVLAVAARTFADYAAGRFVRDPWLDRDAARRFYLEWVDNACAGAMADGILVSERHGQIVGFLTWRTMPSVFDAIGIRIAGQGIAGVLPEGMGAYPALIRAAIVEHRKEYDFAEMDTPVQHVVPQRVFHGVGARLVRAKYTLHRYETSGS